MSIATKKKEKMKSSIKYIVLAILCMSVTRNGSNLPSLDKV